MRWIGDVGALVGAEQGSLRRRRPIVSSLKRRVAHLLARVEHGRLLEGERVDLDVVLERARHAAHVATHVAPGRPAMHVARVCPLLLLRAHWNVAAVLLQDVVVVLVLIFGKASRGAIRGCAALRDRYTTWDVFPCHCCIVD